MTEIHCTYCREAEFKQCKDNPCNIRHVQIHTNSGSVRPRHSNQPVPIFWPTNVQKNLTSESIKSLLGENRASALKSLLSKGDIGVDQLGVEQDGLIVWACKNGYRPVIELLLEHGADPNTRCKFGRTALKHALLGECTHVIDMLVEHGCDVNEPVSGFSYLHYAIRMNKPKMVQCLLHWGADPNAHNLLLQPSALFVCQSAPILELLLSHGADADALDRNKTSLASHLIKTERLELLEVLLDRLGLEHCDGQEYKHAGRSLLHVAASQPKSDCLAYLIKLGLDLDALQRYSSAISLGVPSSTQLDVDEACRMLLSRGAEVDATDLNGHTALHLLVMNHEYGALRRLLLAGARPELPNSRSMTALDLALLIDDERSVKWLLLFGLEPRTIESLATDKERHKRVRRLMAQYAIMRRVAGMGAQPFAAEDEDLSEFERDCRVEIEKMRRIRIEGNVTCFGLLRASKRQLASLALRRSEIMLRIYYVYVRHFCPIYALLLWRNIVLGFECAPIFNDAVERLDALCRNELPAVVIEEIVNSLSVRDMKNLIEISF